MSLDAPIGFLRSDSGFRQVCTHGYGPERPSCLRRDDGPGQYSRVHRPSLGRPELPAAGSILFTRDCRWTHGQRRGPIVRRWAPVGRLEKLARAYQLVAFALACELSCSLGGSSATSRRGSRQTPLASSYATEPLLPLLWFCRTYLLVRRKPTNTINAISEQGFRVIVTIMKINLNLKCLNK
jgi:hypothetical protein